MRCSHLALFRNRDAGPPGHGPPWPAYRRALQAVARIASSAGKVGERQVGGVTVKARQHDKGASGFGDHAIKKIARGYATPIVVIARPGRHAMDVGEAVALRQRLEGVPVERERVLDEAGDVRAPRLVGQVRLLPEIENRPVPDEI